MKSSKLAIVLVDMQDFFLQQIQIETRKELIRNQSEVLRFCTSHKVPIVVVEYKGLGRGQTNSELRKILKSPLAVIRKPYNSAFRDTDLDDLLKSIGVKKLVLMGINGSGCIQDTAIGAISRGYRVVTARGVIASSSERDKNLATSEKWFSAKAKFLGSPTELLRYLTANLV